MREVTAQGSPTTGTFRPYGLDCSGFVDWVFYNVSGGAHIAGHGGGAMMQHTYCTAISWDEAVPGDLVFYPDDEHVGIVCGRDTDGNLMVIHCASGYNNVVITDTDGFVAIGRSDSHINFAVDRNSAALVIGNQQTAKGCIGKVMVNADACIL